VCSMQIINSTSLTRRGQQLERHQRARGSMHARFTTHAAAVLQDARRLL
jgi:hypothetical protein